MSAGTHEHRTISQQLSDHVSGMQGKDLPKEVVEKAKQAILDTLGCMLAGSRDATASLVIKHAVAQAHAGPSMIFGVGKSTAPALAGLANGTSAHVLELDDGHRPSDNHLGGVVVPAALAVAQSTGASGPALIAAVVLAYDVMGRIGEAVLLPRQHQAFHHTGTTGVFGAAAAAGRLLGSSAEQLTNTLGIAGDGASSLSAYRNSPGQAGIEVKPFHAGRAIQNGVTAAYLGRDGFKGPPNILEDKNGFCRAFSQQPRPDLILDGLGKRFAVMESGFKRHATTGGLLTSIDAALWLRNEHKLEPGSIDRIRVFQPKWHLDRRGPKTYPESIGASRPNGAYVVAVALVDGAVTHHQHTPEKLADPRVINLINRLEFATAPEIEEIFEATKSNPQFFVPCAIEIDSGGRTYRRLERTPLGYDPDRPLSWEQVEAKFRSLVSTVIPATQADRLVDWTHRLDRGTAAGDLAGILA
jgi:2-methylcitrate dehydratase PrpD